MCYVDDMLSLTRKEGVREGLTTHPHVLWKMSTDVELTKDTRLMFIGLELEREAETEGLHVHQHTFTRQLLAKHGLDKLSKPITAIQMPTPEEKDGPPTAAELKVLQGHARTSRSCLRMWRSHM